MKTSKFTRPRCICRTCGKNVAARGAGGDYLNACYPVYHKDKDGHGCEGQWREVELLPSSAATGTASGTE